MDSKTVLATSGFVRATPEQISGSQTHTAGRPPLACVDKSDIAFRRNNPLHKTLVRSSPARTAGEDCWIHVRARRRRQVDHCREFRAARFVCWTQSPAH